MIDIQIVEQERQPGQPVTFMITIGCTSRPAPDTRHPGLEAQQYDLICSIEARCTLSADDLDSPLDWIQDAGGYDQPGGIEFDPRTPCLSADWRAVNAAHLPLAVIQNN